MKKIMIITNSDAGLYAFRKELLMRLVEEQYEVWIVSPFEFYQERIEAIGCSTIPMHMDRRGMNPVKDFQLLASYRKLLAIHKPDVVLTYTIKPNVYAGLACQITRTPYLANVTGLGTSLTTKSRMRAVVLGLYKVGLRRAKCVFFQNQNNLEFMKENGCMPDRIRLLSGSGINLEEFSYEEFQEKEEVRILTIGRIMRDKGSRELLAIIPRICREFPYVVFELLGEYEQEDCAFFEPIIENLQKEGMIRYYGYKDNARDYMRSAQLLVHPSYHEGMSNVMLEAAATGRPIVASNIPGCLEIVKHGETGLLCNPQDEESLYQSIRKILSKSVQERVQMGLSARAYVSERFDRNHVVEAYLEEIQEIIDK